MSIDLGPLPRAFDDDGIGVNCIDESPSFTAALLFKPFEAATLYLSCGDSFNPSTQSIESLVSGGRAIFRIEKTNARAPDPTGRRPPVDVTGHYHNVLRLWADI